MGTTVLDGMFRAMTRRVQRQQELIDQLRFDLETQSLENQGLARELAVVIDEISRSNETSRENRWDSIGEEVVKRNRWKSLEAAEAFETARIAGERNES